MTSIQAIPELDNRRDWPAAWRALKNLLRDGSDTVQVFRIMRALNAGNSRRNYMRLIETREGGRIAYGRVELSGSFGDPSLLRAFASGTVGAAYREFVEQSGYSAKGLADISNLEAVVPELQHPYAWFGRRERDIHDIWHILTGYKTDDLGEACLVAFSYAQTKGLGWAVIAAGSALDSLQYPYRKAWCRAVWEGYRNGKEAKWLSGEDYLELLAEPLVDARRRLNIPEPRHYLEAKKVLPANV
ncbi:Coq4 family protein [Novosphingobium sp. FSW06-99]|uniref:Coq4 family protein n=1 Tax=Novosphingobium sp. FSW06-99 TaxID=1739113 RepID=UPI00076D33BD|nr:Coq4 family protein [Novosphingobium sp. FSW06-99]KUR79507.1 ubiquinone biosynthesis protein [Novosphingobium sp. FSW06-99]